jgi:hypothetical protein
MPRLRIGTSFDAVELLPLAIEGSVGAESPSIRLIDPAETSREYAAEIVRVRTSETAMIAFLTSERRW